jgi:hypothetical protein
LAKLLRRAETDNELLALLKSRCEGIRHKFEPARELAAWQALLSEI